MYGCSKEESTVNTSSENYTQESLRGPIIHKVSVGGGDACEAFGQPPGCDGNYSMNARMYSDGSVHGQWQDTFSGGGIGLHVSIDCLMVIEGNSAIVGGYITHGTAPNGDDLTDQYCVTAVWDNGTSNNDPDDQISFSFFGEDPTVGCDYDIGVFPQLDLTRGQVKVW